ncbi:SecY-interacting protein [Pseudaeromonas sp. ZJS20]|uniref:SecY-interacting protein n=1 Tax=Pseudaeromonas aegiceratis TaxID=3153928 RepID=UPI00390C8927
MSDQVVSALSAFFDRWLRYQAHRAIPLQVEVEPDWVSPCLYGPLMAGWQRWRPSLRHAPASMANLETALDTRFHPAVTAFYCHWFSQPLAASFKGLAVTLVQPWNEEDYARLQENLLAHWLMQRRLKLPETHFLATTGRDDRVISLDNLSGEVWLEQLGVGGVARLAPDLASFLARLEPLVAPVPGEVGH